VQRADACENSIKDLKRALKADRLSCHRFWANSFDCSCMAPPTS
jgi:hypothetical protein